MTFQLFVEETKKALPKKNDIREFQGKASGKS